MNRTPRLRAALAAAATAAAASAFFAAPAHASNWPCEVLLCISNPAGPMAVAPCVPPIRRLIRELARGRAFPVCDMARGPNGRSWAEFGARPYEPCPNGTTALPAGQRAALYAPMAPTARPTMPSGSTVSGYGAAATGYIYVGIGDGSDPAALASAAGPTTGYRGETPQPPMVCVAGLRASTYTLVNAESGMVAPVGLYDTVFAAPPTGGAGTIDVYVDERFWQRVYLNLSAP